MPRKRYWAAQADAFSHFTTSKNMLPVLGKDTETKKFIFAYNKLKNSSLFPSVML